MNRAKVSIYMAPKIRIHIIEMEQGIAATSQANISIFSGSDANSPEVEDWVTDGETQQGYIQ